MFSAIFFFVLFIASVSAQTYTVQNGDTCLTITKSLNINFNAFIMSNPGIVCNRMQPGQVVVVSSFAISLAKMNTQCASTIDYTGGTCSEMAAAIPNFYNINPGIFPICNNLQYGQKICTSNFNTQFPTQAPTQAPTQSPTGSSNTIGSCTRYHIVQRDETCNSITALYGISFNPFIYLNNGIKCNQMQPGQSVCVASSSIDLSIRFVCSTANRVELPANTNCATLAATIPNFYNMNPGILAICNNLQPGQFICVA